MFYTLILAYLLGGLTLVPILVLAILAFVFYTSLPIDPPKPPNASEPSDAPATSPRNYSLKSWLTVRRNFEPSPSSYIGIVRTLLDARSARPRRAEDSYYSVLKGKVLYLYEDEMMSECAAAIDVGRCEISVSPNHGLLDGELFAKRNAVVVREQGNNTDDAPRDKKDDMVLDSEARDPPAPWYIFFRSVTDMEDWYLALLAASLSSTVPPHIFAPFPYAAHRALIDSLDALPDLIPTRWLNALLGRLFLGVKGTKALEAWVVGRLMKKLSKVKTPSWLSAVVVRSFDAGDVAPVISKPMLKELTPEGEASVGVDVSYIAPPSGGIRITLSATATISLPATPSLSLLGFKKDNRERDAQKDKEKPYEVSLVLAVIVRRVEGNVLFKIKRPPSNRLWYAFTTMPHMEVEVTPVVSDRHIRWGMVLSGIEGKLREIIQDSVVLPNMDDIPFFDTTPYPLRGGIFADAFAAPSFADPSEPHTASSAPDHGEHAVSGANMEDAKPVQRTHSVDVLVDGDDVADQNGPSEPDVGVRRAESFSSGTARKRRSWFGGRKSEESDDDGETHWKGRSEEGPGIQVLVSQDEEPELPVGPPLPPRRSQSTRSVSDASTFARQSSPPLVSTSSSSAGLSTSAPSASYSVVASVSTSSPSSPASSSFLSALKSRGAGMAEKQPAIKEAMRKWGMGVNWAAGLRKHDNNSSRNRISSHDQEKESQFLEVDHGDAWSGNNAERRSASPRGSYADLRKKVEQRERERVREGSENGTDPIEIPSSADEVSLNRRRSTSRSETSSIRRFSPTGGGPAPFLSPSAPKTTTELQTSPGAPTPTSIRSGSSSPPRSRTPERREGERGLSSPLALDDPMAPSPPPIPIRAQPPKAATMTIPGIHARHKGEVMGFGSAPPSQPLSSAPTAPAPDVQPGTAGKTIQNVYRLLSRGAGGEVKEIPSDGREEDARLRTVSTPASVPSMSSPPPLPLRSQGMPHESNSITTPTAESEPVVPSPLSSPASQALKSVAIQDAAARQPPSIPRRHTSQSNTPSPRSSEQGDAASITAEGSEQAAASQWELEASSTSKPWTPIPNDNESWKPPLPPRRNSTRPAETAVS